ncbi:hypothetical protein [Salinilacihabitans rarus]|uniref:hypothetical protein n=1 Tax=Salinilacihabitans rarus TaxID=2961596 RepID=UPI0020C8FF95|nr:hypothetical protein [Salinilacihabitans rarus]
MTDDSDPPTILSRLVRFVREAGAPSEDDTDRDGFLSYHAESHAAGVGLGVGIAASATGDLQYAGAILAMAFGLNRGPTLSNAKITEDVRQEPHYALGGLGLGLLLGSVLGSTVSL